MPRLGYLVPEFPTQTHIFFWQEIQALRNLGEEVFLISTRRPSPLACRHQFAPTAIKETHYLYPPNLSDVATALSLAGRLPRALSYLMKLETKGITARIRQIGLLASAIKLVRWTSINGIRHVHGHSCADSAHVLALARLMGGSSYSLTLHGDLDVYGRDHKAKMRGATFVSAVGSHLRRQIVERVGLASERVITSYMGVDTNELAKLGLDRSYEKGHLHLATVARLHPAKGHMHALAAVSRSRQLGLKVRYTIAGEGPFKDAILAKIRELGLQSEVTLTGSLSNKEVYRLLSEADALLLPSTGLGEAWPVSVMEAMAAGLPVIASVIGATPEMITSGQDGILVPQKDENALIESIMFLANDVESRRRIGASARITADHRFDVKVSADRLLNTIHNISDSEPSH